MQDLANFHFITHFDLRNAPKKGVASFLAFFAETSETFLTVFLLNQRRSKAGSSPVDTKPQTLHPKPYALCPKP